MKTDACIAFVVKCCTGSMLLVVCQIESVAACSNTLPDGLVLDSHHAHCHVPALPGAQ